MTVAPRDCVGDPIDVGDLVRWRLADRFNHPDARMLVIWVDSEEDSLFPGTIRVMGDSGFAETVLSEEVVVVAKGGQ